MAFTVIVTPGKQYAPGEAWTDAKHNLGFNPTVQVSGNLQNADNVSPVQPTVTGRALVWNQTTTKWEPSTDTLPVGRAYLEPFLGATGSVAGSRGGVPAPTAGQGGLFLRGDSTWAAIPGQSGADIFLNQSFI